VLLAFSYYLMAKTQADDWKKQRKHCLKSFAYWMVYYVAFGIQKIALPTGNPAAEFEDNCCSVLLLTFAATLSPLHRFAVRQVED